MEGPGEGDPSDPGPRVAIGLGRLGGVEIAVRQTTRPEQIGADALVVSWDRIEGPGNLGRYLSELHGGLEVEGARSPAEPAWAALSEAEVGRLGGLRALVVATVRRPADLLPTGARASSPVDPRDVGDATRASLRLAGRRGAHHLAVPLLGAGAAGLGRASAADAMLAACREELGGGLGAPSTLRRITFIAPTPEEMHAISAAWAGFDPHRLANDRPEGADQLDVRAELIALSDMLMLREVQPPFAVGVLGGWGTGKSYAMHLMKERIRAIRAETLSSDGWVDPPPSPFVGHVYPIEFNAWTYARSDLWAALMHRVLTELDRQMAVEAAAARKGGPLDGDLWRELIALEPAAVTLYDAFDGSGHPERFETGSLFATLREVHRQDRELLERAASDGQQAEGAIAERRRQLESEVRQDVQQEIVGGVWRAGLEELAQVVRADGAGLGEALRRESSELDALLDEAAASADQVRSLATAIGDLRLPRGQALVSAGRASWKRTAAVLGGIVAAIVAAVVVGRQREWFEGVAVAVAGLAVPLVVAGNTIRGVMRAFERRLRSIQERVAAQAAQVESTVGARVESAVAEDPEVHAQQMRIVAAEAEKRRLELRVGLVAQYESVGELVRTRLQAGTYLERLGVMQQVSDDLASLTASLMVSDHDLYETEKRGAFPRGPARVVLFVDDLDRCPPHKVVEVLEATQLLLATGLFVVVLALDVDYVTKALEKVYEGVLGCDGGPTGLDYLEKIIQIPYRTRPMTEPGTLHLLAEMLAVEDVGAAGPESAIESALDLRGEGGEADGGGPLETVPQRVLDFDQDDLRVLAAACAAGNPSPRAVKRLANSMRVFRLVWARRGRSRPTGDEVGCVALLLVLAGSHPVMLRDAFARLDRADPEKRVIDVLASMPAPPEGATNRWLRYGRWEASLARLTDLPAPNGRHQRLGAIPVDVARDCIQFAEAFSFTGAPRPEAQPGTDFGE